MKSQFNKLNDNSVLHFGCDIWSSTFRALIWFLARFFFPALVTVSVRRGYWYTKYEYNWRLFVHNVRIEPAAIRTQIYLEKKID